MTKKIKLTIVSSTWELRFFPRKNMDALSISIFYRSIPVSNPKSDLRNPLINLLDCYLGLTSQSITYLSLSKKSAIPLLHGFIGAIISPTFINASENTKDIYRRTFIATLKSMALEIPRLAFEENLEIASRLWSLMKVDHFQQEYYHGWHALGKNGEQAGFLKLAWIWNTIGPDVARALHQATCRFSERYAIRSKGNFIPFLNYLVDYIEKTHPDLDRVQLSHPDFTIKIIEGFCRDFFESKVGLGNCLQTTIKRWNDALPFMESVLLDSKVFARPNRKFPYIEPSRKVGSEMKVTINDEGLIVKDKLIVEVPISLTDDEVIKLLFQQISNAVNKVLIWADIQAKDIYGRFIANRDQFEFMDFDFGSVQIKSKYRKTQLRLATIGEVSYRLGLPTSYSLEPFIFMLIKEHPLITESFLFNLKLYDKHGKFVGLERTDRCVYLIGYKRRKGGEMGLQRVALNEKSLSYVEQVMQLTQPLRNYLKVKNDDNYRFMFLSCRSGFSYPTPISSVLTLGQTAAFNIRVKQFQHLMSDTDEQIVKQLVCNLTPTRFRATVGLQVYLETGSAKAMSEALGHAKYKPELLSHYLPEPILSFFQSRWVRIFQKGIICESMKNSSMLLRASNFDSFEELDKFLNKHVFSLPVDPDKAVKKQGNASKQIYISVDENILVALLSIRSAVQLLEPQLVNPKACYWSKFSSLLEIEIENNMYDPDLSQALNSARSKVNPNLMKSMVYQENMSHSSIGII